MGGGVCSNYLVRCHRQRRLFRDLPAKWWRGGGSSDWEQEARLLGYLAHPYRTVAIQADVGEAPMGGNARVLLNRVLTHGVRLRPAWARLLLLLLLLHARLEPWRGLGSRPGVRLDWRVWLVLVDSGLLRWDLLHGAVELRR